MTDAEKAYARLGECMKKVFDEIGIQNLTSTDLYLLLGEKIDLINRQKAEIERLQKAIKVQDIMIEQQDYKIKSAKTESIKEYKEKVKAILMNKGIYPVVVKNALNEAEKEMEGESGV